MESKQIFNFLGTSDDWTSIRDSELPPFMYYDDYWNYESADSLESEAIRMNSLSDGST